MLLETRPAQLREIAHLRVKYVDEMNCQVIHDSIHGRRGWTREYLLLQDNEPVGYGSVAVSGPWQDRPALYEFFVEREHRMRMFDLFESLLSQCGAKIVETQSNDGLLTTMLHTFARNVETESILFEDAFQTSHHPADAAFRAATPEDTETLLRLELDDGAGWIVTDSGEIAGAGDILYHYNRPYGDVYMKVAEPFRRRGFGTYLVQELKAVCRQSGSVPAARCNVGNRVSRKTLQGAGFVPCGALLVGELPQ